MTHTSATTPQFLLFSTAPAEDPRGVLAAEREGSSDRIDLIAGLEPHCLLTTCVMNEVKNFFPPTKSRWLIGTALEYSGICSKMSFSHMIP